MFSAPKLLIYISIIPTKLQAVISNKYVLPQFCSSEKELSDGEIKERNNKWHAQVRRVGHKQHCNSFISKNDAQAWAYMIESDIDKRVAFENLIQRY